MLSTEKRTSEEIVAFINGYIVALGNADKKYLERNNDVISALRNVLMFANIKKL